VTRISVPLDPGGWLEPGYLLDFTVKSVLAFHLAWALVGLSARSRAGRGALLPEPLLGWALGAALYMAAGYAHNSLAGVGYPLRLTWALFPAVLYVAARELDAVAPSRRLHAVAVALVVINGMVSVAGVGLDRGESGLTAPALIRRMSPER
jgi:hypothetical protein